MIIYEKTDKWYFKLQQVVQGLTVTTSDSNWQQAVQWMTMSGNEWQRVVWWVTMNNSERQGQRVATNDNRWYSRWQRVVERLKTSETKWEVILGFRIKKLCSIFSNIDYIIEIDWYLIFSIWMSFWACNVNQNICFQSLCPLFVKWYQMIALQKLW